jgi:SAM-dependent methyltransferase
MTAEYFDNWYADIAASPLRQQLFTEHLGLPPEVGPSNHVPLSGLRDIAAALALAPGDELVDLACGRGGPGMWIARELGASLIGVDFSAEAIGQALERRSLFGLGDRAMFAVGTLEDSGLPADSADAVVCIDAFQFATDAGAAAAEIKRILRPGGRVVLTTWEAVSPGDERVGARIRKVDLDRSLRSAEFENISVVERADWHETARQFWESVVAIDAGSDPALESMRAEGERSLPNHDRMRRVMAAATC